MHGIECGTNSKTEQAIETIDRIWQQFQHCAEQIRAKTSEAELILLLIADEPFFSQPDSIHSLPSSAPGEPDVASDAERWGAYDPSNFALDTSIRTVTEVWNEWKVGTGKPSVEYMNQRFGPLAFVQNRKQRLEATTRQRIVEEIELHLENGRELDEVLAVATLALESYGNDLRRLARAIITNAEKHRATLFEPSSSS